MREDKRSLFGFVMAGSMLIFLLGYLCVASYADELPASHPACVACNGTLSPQGRWCDNGNGTVTDMSTGLIWLKDASWGGKYPLWAEAGVDRRRFNFGSSL
ncbi:MAG: hypothetical protein HQK56_07565 [Deltaproteobacteria bacterium]|nr:hypothetical protein [Deltaproteobacteria bacterium]